MGISMTIDPLLQANIQIYPNPTDGQLFVKNQDISLQGVEIRVLDMLGRALLFEKKATWGAGEIHELQLGSLVSGIYLLDIQTGARSAFFRIEVLR